MHTEHDLWDQLIDKGLRAHAVGLCFLDDHPLTNLSEVLGIGTHQGLSRMMRMSGISEAYITGVASAYDKAEALCRVLPLWIGHPYVTAIQDLIRWTCGLTTPLTLHTLPEIWRAVASRLLADPLTLADLPSAAGVGRLTVSLTLAEFERLSEASMPSKGRELQLLLTDPTGGALWRSSQCDRLTPQNGGASMALAVSHALDSCVARGCGSVAVDLAACDAFVRPNPYTPALAAIKLQQGEAITTEESRLLMSQTLRLLGGECVKRGLPLTLLHLPSEVLTPLCNYLRGCNCLPDYAAVTHDPAAVMLSKGSALSEVDPLTARVTLPHRVSDLAASVPLGCLGGLYLPIRGALDLPLWAEAGQTFCRCLVALDDRVSGGSDFETQLFLAERILC